MDILFKTYEVPKNSIQSNKSTINKVPENLLEKSDEISKSSANSNNLLDT